ncbi:MAG: aminotransferase class I/II-fold pyridoxal phosphate-dependent enzyme [Gammaproteobacteria bacterium]|nr:MAG: aminotransferase class I/II-fold pyridoxal phosphate-dependent enzyme [Gammaproteobacteria bacterium]
MSYPATAERMQRIAPFRVMEILARAQQMEKAGRDIVHMEVGEPDFPAPEVVNGAACRALTKGRTHYTPALGIPALREAIADYYRARFGLAVEPARVLVTPGASGALQLILGVLVEQGDCVGIQDPGYPCNRHMIELYGGRTRTLPTIEAPGEAWSEAAGAPGLCGMLLASPANPTGEVFELSRLDGLYRALAARERFLIVDEIYQGLQYEGTPATALALGSEHLFVINSFSKFFGMTGYRLGWVVVPETWVDPIERLAQNLFLAPPTMAQYAALHAFDEAVLEELERRRQIFRQRRDRLFSGLRALGFGLPPTPPAGAFYVYASLPEGYPGDGESFCRALLEEAGVAVTPGIDFGTSYTERCVRFAYTTDLDRIDLGLRRMGEFLARGG